MFKNPQNPKVSVIIPFYNCKYVQHAIESVLKQTYKNFEIIVVDDGSTQYRELIDPYKEKIKYIFKKNGGTATALNFGMKHAAGDLFAWLSSDDMFLPNKLQKQVDFMKATNADIVYTNFDLINDKNELTKSKVGVHLAKRIDLLRFLMKGCPINGSTVLMKMDVLRGEGQFDESLIYTHDYDMWIRLAMKKKVVSLNESLLKYRIHETMGSKKHTAKQMQEVKVIQLKYKQMLQRFILLELKQKGGR
ncbi:glycosyltransferase involved in cell wall biosynthesis [Scopulibacillus darangshiensis]|uniref:Glycosyltransferase involved in cell wall biosynthesis n=1 Tax=Scopulibacillus darangshiensis TaxID=442528 RepID=A0A4R2NR35_9BACL|nr:glycosyltransferase [Scopulibacillus darangshiensis]TCP23795.1 glycosyltransferase involved in cell wall biosynthesis [Scopulibacillus darangshiensis]